MGDRKIGEQINIIIGKLAEASLSDGRSCTERCPRDLSDNVPAGVKLVVLTVKGYLGE